MDSQLVALLSAIILLLTIIVAVLVYVLLQLQETHKRIVGLLNTFCDFATEITGRSSR
jgi:uncharacterized protein YqhQ